MVGLVFVDASHPEQVERLPAGLPEAPPTIVMRVVAATGVQRLLMSLADLDVWPEEIKDVVSAFMPQTVTGLIGEMDATDEIFAQAGATGPLGDRPLIVLTAGKWESFGGVSDETLREADEVWWELQSELASLSTNSDHRMVQDATHYIQWDDPRTVIEAIREVVVAVREGRPVRKTDG